MGDSNNPAIDLAAHTNTNNNLGHCLVTGAAGFVGSHLVKALLLRGLKVRALVRNTPLQLSHENLECFPGDIQNSEQMLRACEGIDTVFHTAAMIATLGGSAVTQAYRDQARAINVGGTSNIIAGCHAHGVRKLIHTSSVDTCFNSAEDLHMDEHTPYATYSICEYVPTKIEAEQSVLAANGNQGLASCALRPDGIWGAGGSLMLDILTEKLRAGMMVARIGGMGGLHDHVHVDNLVHAHLLAADALTPNSPPSGKAYFITDGEPAHMFDFVRPFFEGMGYKIPKANIPAGPIMLIMECWQWLHFKLGIPEPAFSPHELNKLTISTVAYSDAAKRDFGYEPVVAVAQGMEDAVAYYLAQEQH
ncbi:MAG: 3beta-hydroxy-delta5-steroid dehydrogenase/steroid delta-isomerase [Halioglobus sp.]|jgi:3beta-hydroxy-delta5-steroid dehydrogenase/steroid delta-isomerase